MGSTPGYLLKSFLLYHFYPTLQKYGNTFCKKTLGISPNGASVPEASESSSPDASTFDSNSSKSLSTSEKKNNNTILE